VVQPNVNVRRIDMSRLTERVDMKSLKNAIMMYASKASETIPNLDAKFYFLPYKFCDDDPASARAELFYCMSFVHDGVTHKNLPVPFYAGQMTIEDIVVFMDLFNIKGHADGTMQAMRLFLQNYSTMRDWDGCHEY
jgi:hypothetical protein